MAGADREMKPSPSGGPVLPGGSIGILGGGQLGRMMSMAAKRMGYRVTVLDPTPDCPAAQVSDGHIVAEYADAAAVQSLASCCDVVTVEFENVPAETLASLGPTPPVRPDPGVLHIAQDRIREKTFLQECGVPVAAWRPVRQDGDLQAALEAIGRPAVLKVAGGGYDGKGQVLLGESSSPDEVASPSVLEEFVPLSAEVSVIVARSPTGEIACYPVSENAHRRHILDTAVMPATVSEQVTQEARALAARIAEALALEGLLAVEMFIGRDGRLLVNEIAPRPHNSGHQTFDAVCKTSQFEQSIRAVCGLPLGPTDVLRPTAIANLLGDLWVNGEPDWSAALRLLDVKLHLYGKAEARPGRKMGHITAIADTPEAAVERARYARRLLARA